MGEGCTSPYASNFNTTATHDNGSCEFAPDMGDNWPTTPRCPGSGRSEPVRVLVSSAERFTWTVRRTGSEIGDGFGTLPAKSELNGESTVTICLAAGKHLLVGIEGTAMVSALNLGCQRSPCPMLDAISACEHSTTEFNIGCDASSCASEATVGEPPTGAVELPTWMIGLLVFAGVLLMCAVGFQACTIASPVPSPLGYTRDVMYEPQLRRADNIAAP